ncbi:MAG: NRDE family protein [Chitinophagaceae bacterium]
MCTVTFIPSNNKIFLAHNRDEQSSRAIALAPALYSINGHQLIFPKDSAAGGTWAAVNDNGAAAVLLNGAFTAHLHQPPYRKSRGLAFLDFMAEADAFAAYEATNLSGIEPFTVIIWSNEVLYECRWDGSHKTITRPAAGIAHTWSSVTLYNDAVLAKRQWWFNDWHQQHPDPTLEEIIQYHLSGGDGDICNDLRMNRAGKLLTVSITAIEICDWKSTMHYLDLQSATRARQEFNFAKAVAIPQ